MKGASAALLLFGLVIGGLAKSSLKHALDLVANKAELEKELQGLTLREIIGKASKLNNDLNSALNLVEAITRLDGILDENMKFKNMFLVNSNQLDSLFYDVEMDVNKLPDLTDNMDDWIFIDQCIEGAFKTNFDEITDKRDFLNEVFQQVYTCQASGIQFAVDLTDFGSIPVGQLTKQDVGEALIILEAVVVEMAHLLKFQDNFVVGVIKDYDTSSHNELVHDLIGHRWKGKPTSPKPPRGTSPSLNEKVRASGEAPEEIDADKRGKKGQKGKPTSPKPPRGTSPSLDEEVRASGEAPEEIDADKRGRKEAGKKGGQKGQKGKPTSPKPPRGTSPRPNNKGDKDDEERVLLLRILNILRGSKSGKKGETKEGQKGKPTSPKPPRGTSPSLDEEVRASGEAPEEIDADKRGKKGQKGQKGKPTSPKPPRGTSPSLDEEVRASGEAPEEVDSDKRGSKVNNEERGLLLRILNVLRRSKSAGQTKVGKKGEKKGQKGKPTSPKPPRGTSPSLDEEVRASGEAPEEIDADKRGKKGGKKGQKGKPTSPKPPRGTSPSLDEVRASGEAPEEIDADKRGKKGGQKGQKGKPTSPKPPRGTSPSMSNAARRINEGRRALKIEVNDFLDKVKAQMKRGYKVKRGQ